MIVEQMKPSRKNWVGIPSALQSHFDRTHALAIKVAALMTAVNAISNDDKLRDLRIEMIQELDGMASELEDALDAPERFAEAVE